MAQRNIVQEIHEHFEFDLLEVVRQANDLSILEAAKPATLALQPFCGIVERYRTQYPQSNFITHAQLEHICYKYGIRVAPYFMYPTNIPRKNMAEIMNFKLAQPERNVTIPALFRKIDKRVATHTLLSGWIPIEEAQKHGAVYSIMGKVAVTSIMNQYNFYAFYRIWGEQYGWVHLGGKFTTAPPLESNTREARVIWTAESKILSEPFKADYASHVCPLIVAPLADLREGLRVQGVFLTPQDAGGFRTPSMPKERWEQYLQEGRKLKGETGIATETERYLFLSQANERTAMAAQRLEAEREKQRQQAEREQYLRQLRIDDPIVLQPVKFGYLVVTKWGKEAEIAEIRSPNEN